MALAVEIRKTNKLKYVGNTVPPGSISATAAAAVGVSNVDHSPKPAMETPAETEATNSVSNANTSSSYASIKLECKRALAALLKGNYLKALRLIRDLCSKHENPLDSALIHRIQGTICAYVASSTDDANAKQQQWRSAIESARKAASLSPGSIEFAHFYATLLYQAANEREEYEEVMLECERALAIENPVDPANESFLDEDQQEISTAEDRIAFVQSELRSLIRRSKNRRLVQDSSPKEVTKVAKSMEERRKEIEVKVAAAARVLQGFDNSGDVTKGASSNERRDRVLPYWNSMSLDGKKEFLRIKISDLKAHFSSSKDGSLSEVLDEALSFGEANKVWRFWACCCCDQIYDDAGSFMQHVMEVHMGSLSPNAIPITPVKRKWAEMLLNFPWKPLELTAVTRTEFQDVDWMDFDGNRSSSGSLLNENWSLSDDDEREKLLERIHANFQALIEHKCLASSHLKKVIHFAVEELQAIACGCGSQLSSNMDRTPLCICFLGAPELTKILDFLHVISQSSDLSDKSNVADDSKTVMQGVKIAEKILFSPDASFLVLDEKFLPCKIPISSSDDDVNDISSAPTSSHISYDNGIYLDSDALLSWIFTGTSTGEQLAYWKFGIAEKAQQGLEILQVLQKESYHLQSSCERKSKHLNYEKALQALSDLCLDERSRREHVTELNHRRFDTVLKERREELIGNDNGITIFSYRLELDAIEKVLKYAESLIVNQSGFEETRRGVQSHLCDEEPGEDDQQRTMDYLHQVDSCIEAAILNQKQEISLEISKIDARILGIIAGMDQLEVKFQNVSSNDFQSILIPLVKSFLQARLEYLAEKDAIEKSNAASEGEQEKQGSDGYT